MKRGASRYLRRDRSQRENPLTLVPPPASPLCVGLGDKRHAAIRGAEMPPCRAARAAPGAVEAGFGAKIERQAEGRHRWMAVAS